MKLIELGSHVYVHNLASARTLRNFAEIRVQTSEVETLKILPKEAIISKTEFPSFRRNNGRVGVRIYILVLTTVHCANMVGEQIGQQTGDVAIPHLCGCSQLGQDLVQTRWILKGYTRHPNVGAVLLVGLGCEIMPTVEIKRTVNPDSRGVESTPRVRIALRTCHRR